MSTFAADTSLSNIATPNPATVSNVINTASFTTCLTPRSSHLQPVEAPPPRPHVRPWVQVRRHRVAPKPRLPRPFEEAREAADRDVDGVEDETEDGHPTPTFVPVLRSVGDDGFDRVSSVVEEGFGFVQDFRYHALVQAGDDIRDEERAFKIQGNIVEAAHGLRRAKEALETEAREERSDEVVRILRLLRAKETGVRSEATKRRKYCVFLARSREERSEGAA